MPKEPKCFKCEDVFPFIFEVVDRLCRQVGKATHAAIVDEMLKHPEADQVIGRAAQRCPRYKKPWIASTMVKWMSQHYTTERKDVEAFQQRFQRYEGENQDWVYLRR